MGKSPGLYQREQRLASTDRNEICCQSVKDSLFLANPRLDLHNGLAYRFDTLRAQLLILALWKNQPRLPIIATVEHDEHPAAAHGRPQGSEGHQSNYRVLV